MAELTTEERLRILRAADGDTEVAEIVAARWSAWLDEEEEE